MSITVNAIAAVSSTAPLERSTVARRDLGPRDVMVKIAYVGICHSDLHTVRGDWGDSAFPLVVGHEIAGTVESIGAEVRNVSVGDRVGVGCIVGSCRTCANCAAGSEQHCLNGAIGTYGATDRDGSVTQGGYSTHIVVDEDFVLSVPEQIDLAYAAPLLCAGVTTYSPLRKWKVGAGQKVAIVGLGGLGHLAVKFARQFGADVTVLSRSDGKREEALRLGADSFYATEDPATFRSLANEFDLIFNTVSAAIDINAYLALLRLDGTLVSVGMPGTPLAVDAINLIVNARTLAGSGIGGIGETQDMLDYAAEHGVLPEIEIIRADQINKAWDRLDAADVRYRFVIDASTLA